MLVKMICPRCGANLEIDDAESMMTCKYCGYQQVNLTEKVEVTHKVDRSNEPNLYITYNTNNPNVQMVTRIVSTGQKNTYVNGQTMTFHLPAGPQEVILKIGKKNYSRKIVIPEDNQPVRISASFSGRANIGVDQPNYTVTAPDGTVRTASGAEPKKKQSVFGIIGFILSLTMYLSPVGLALGIVDTIRAKKDPDHAHGLAKAAMVIGGILTIVLFVTISSCNKSGGTSSDTKSTTAAVQKTTEAEKDTKDTAKDVKDDIEDIKEDLESAKEELGSIGDEFAEAIGAGGDEKKEEQKPAENIGDEKAEYIKSCKTPVYRDIERKPDNYEGERFVVEGTVLQVSEGWLDSVTLRVAANANGYDDVWYVTYTKSSDEARILEDDMVILYGECDGVKTYKSVIGSTVTIPALKVKYIEIKELEEPEYTSQIIKFDISKDSFDDLEYYAVVEIKNTGSSNLYIKADRFDIEDAGGHLIQTDDFGVSVCPDVILAGETGYIYSSYGISLDNVENGNGLVLKPYFDVKATFASPDIYEVSDVSLSNGTFGAEMTGRITNKTEEDQSYLYINVVYYDADGGVLGITGTSITDLTAGKTSSFEISGISLPDNVTTDTIADYKVIARASHYEY